MDLMQLKTVQWISIAGALAGILGLFAVWDSKYKVPVMAAIVILIVIVVFVEIQKDRISVLFSGITKFYRSFPPESNKEVFQQAQREYCYLGITFSSVATSFLDWYDSKLRGNVDVRLLITYPEATDLLEFQARYEHNLFKEALSAEEQKLISDTIARTKKAIELTLQTLLALPQRGAKIQVRLHHERLRQWMHAVDGREGKLYLGMLRKGEIGLQSPVIVLGPRHRHWTVFNHYLEVFESIWENAVPVEQYVAAKVRVTS